MLCRVHSERLREGLQKDRQIERERKEDCTQSPRLLLLLPFFPPTPTRTRIPIRSRAIKVSLGCTASEPIRVPSRPASAKPAVRVTPAAEPAKRTSSSHPAKHVVHGVVSSSAAAAAETTEGRTAAVGVVIRHAARGVVLLCV
jgi:hypothetical protein